MACKVLEHIIHSFVMKHLEKYNVFADTQHGFRAKRSTVGQLLLIINDIAKSLNASNSVHAAVLDFTKAFDKVPHRRLLIKLNLYGIRGNPLQWFESFLLKRCQSVICSGKSSKSSPITSGVPQGTVPGPLLFLLYINDLPVNLKSQTRLFADDALVYGVISADIDTNNLQDDLCLE